MRTQGQARFPYNASHMLVDATNKERGLIPTSENKPKYSPKNVVNLVLGGALLVVIAGLVWEAVR